MILIDAQSYKELRCSCPPPHPSETTGITFTQAELEAAWKQMQYERNEDALRARRMLTWVCEQAGIDPKAGSFSAIGYITGISPFAKVYHFTFTHQTYGPYLYDFIDALAPHQWAKHVHGEYAGPVYEVNTPEGTYEVHFSYFDNHSTGW